MNDLALVTKDDIFSTVRRSILEVLPDVEEHEIRGDRSLEEIGANSIERADVLMTTIETLNINIPRVELFGPKNIDELVDLLHEKIQ